MEREKMRDEVKALCDTEVQEREAEWASKTHKPDDVGLTVANYWANVPVISNN